MVDLDKLEELAKMATPSEPAWLYFYSAGRPGGFYINNGAGKFVGVIGNEVSDQSRADARFIAAFNPEAALALIAELREAREAQKSASGLSNKEIIAFDKAISSAHKTARIATLNEVIALVQTLTTPNWGEPTNKARRAVVHEARDLLVAELQALRDRP